jgi:hypothetical protein
MKASSVLAVALAALCVAAVAPAAAQNITDVDILNFALNLEYLEGEFYSYATTGAGLAADLRGGGPASTGGAQVDFQTGNIRRIAMEIANDEVNHVKFLRMALGTAAVAIPELNIGTAFSDAADAALNTTLTPRFTPYLTQNNDLVFLHGAFIFEDVGVTAYQGAAALIASKDYLSAAAGILAVEAYHAGTVRSLLYVKAETVIAPYGVKVVSIISAISKLRGAVGGGKDQGIVTSLTSSNIVPTDANSITFGRTTDEVLAIVYLGGSGMGGFFPSGLNGLIK